MLPRAQQRGFRSAVKDKIPAIAGMASVVLAYLFGPGLFADLHNIPLTVLLFLWLFGVMMACAFGAVRHATAIADRLGEPYGTLVLTLSMVVIEVSLLAAIMLHGENNPTLARDAMFATLMIGLNGMVGAALLMGAMRYWEQEYNLAGARAFLVVIASLAVFALIIPNYTKTAPDPSEDPDQGAAIRLDHGVCSTWCSSSSRRSGIAPSSPSRPATDMATATRARTRERIARRPRRHARCSSSCPSCCWRSFSPSSSISASRISICPDALGGVLIAILVLSPEGLTAFHAALANQLQRAVNVCLGSALATIGLTIPAALIIGLIDRLQGASRARPGGDGAAHPDAVRQRAHLRRRAHQCVAGRRAPAAVHRLRGADLEPLRQLIPCCGWDRGHRCCARGFRRSCHAAAPRPLFPRDRLRLLPRLALGLEQGNRLSRTFGLNRPTLAVAHHVLVLAHGRDPPRRRSPWSL